jgi:tetratricopeptide (TPR) repeat protein
LEGVKGFYAEALRGKIRSLQLRFEEAWHHFERAENEMTKEEETIATLVQQLTCDIWCFENAIAEARVESDEGFPFEPWMPELPERIQKDYPEIMYTLVLRQYAEGLLRLHFGHYLKAAEYFEKLIVETTDKVPWAQLPLYYLGLGASRYNLGEKEEGRRNLENAGLEIHVHGELLAQVRLSGALCGMYEFLGEEEEAQGWRLFLERLPCPEATKEAFLKRGEMIVTRSREAGGLLLL